MKGKTIVKTLLFALSLSPLGVMAEDDVTKLPLKQACADSETSVWCAESSDDSGIVEVRHPLAQIMDQRTASDYFYNSETIESCDLCFDN